MKYSLRQIIDSLPPKKNSRSSIWVRLVIRKLSFLVTFLFINGGITANATSVLSAVVAAIGGAFLCFDFWWCRIVGVIIINFWLVLDCVDGNIARCCKTSSYMGEFYDAIGGYSAIAFSMIGIGVAAYNTNSILPDNQAYWFIIIGSLGAILNIFSRLIYQRYTNAVFTTNLKVGASNDMPENYTEDKKSFAYIRERFDKEFGISGLFMVLILIAPFINRFDVVCVLYSAYYIFAFCITFYMYCVKAKRYDNEITQKYGANIK